MATKDKTYDLSVQYGASPTSTVIAETMAVNREGSEFDHFESLAGKLVKVPKSEIDEKREKKS